MFTSLLPITPGAPYLDRDEIEKVKAGIAAPVPQCIAVVGLPGSGKSSLLRICSSMVAPNARAAIVDLRGIPTLNDASFNAAISEALGYHDATIDAALKRSTDSFARVILFFDEFDRVGEGVSGDALARLRALVAGRHLGSVAVVTASTRPLYELCEAVRGSAFYNIFRTLPISSFTKETFGKWSSSARFELNIDDLWVLTNGYPALVTRLIMEGWMSIQDHVPLGALDGVAGMLNSLSAEEKTVLAQCAEGGDTADVIAMSPKEAVMYLQRSGLIDGIGTVSAALVSRYAKAHLEIASLGGVAQHVTVYTEIRRLELALRAIVRRAISEGRLSATCFRDLLEERQYVRLQERKQRFRFSLADDCDAAHFPELGLVIKKHYGLFSAAIQTKKQEFDRAFEVIAPIRNEEFHFHFIPEVELKRGEVALHDLNSRITM